MPLLSVWVGLLFREEKKNTKKKRASSSQIFSTLASPLYGTCASGSRSLTRWMSMVSVQNSRVKSAHSARRVLCSVVPSLRIQKPYVPHAIATAVHAHVRARQAARFPEARARRTARGFVVRISSKFARRSSLSGYRASLSERCPDLRHVIRTMFGYLRTLNFALRRLRDCVVPSV